MIGFPPKKTFDLAASHPRPVLRAASAEAAPPRLPSARPEGFVPMDVLLREMGLAAGAPDGRSDAPLVAPHPADVAEFSPPRPLRRPPTRFAAPQDGD
ncbi:MAG: hypothetical protein AB7D00_14005 [Rhodospirillaceae bacterium]